MIKHSKEYSSYKEYLKHQKKKTQSEKVENREKKNFENNVLKFHTMYQYYFDVYKISPKKAVCAGSRLGAEVKALQDLGIDAIGYDLVEYLPYTKYGDIHSLPVENNSVDFIFTNIFDHSLYPDIFAHELERICKPSGHILMQLAVGKSDDNYKAIEVDEYSDILKLFEFGKKLNEKSIMWRGSINTEILLRIEKGGL